MFGNFDSIYDGGRAIAFCDGMRDQIERISESKEDIDWTQWRTDDHKEYHQQTGIKDCGVWMSQCLLWSVLGVKPNFKQEDMARFRQKMMVSLFHGKIAR